MSELVVPPECEAVRSGLSAFVDGEIDAAERGTIERHLQGCADCRAEVELLRLVTQSLRLAPKPEPSEAMRGRLLAQVRADLPRRRIVLDCTEQHGNAVIRRQEVRTYPEPALPPRPVPLAALPAGPMIQQFCQQLSAGRYGCQIIMSYYGRNNDE